jgi:hypothetical protein
VIEFDLAMEMSNPSMEGKYVSMYELEGAQNSTPLQIAQRVLTNPQITTLEPFGRFYCPKD